MAGANFLELPSGAFDGDNEWPECRTFVEECDLKSIRSLAHRVLITALRDARKQAGMSQEEVARRLRRPQSFVSAYESGEPQDRRSEVHSDCESDRHGSVRATEACDVVHTSPD